MENNSMLLIIFLGSFVVNFTTVNTIRDESSLDDFFLKIAKQMHNALWMVNSEIDKYQKQVANNAKITSRNLFEKFEKLKKDFSKSRVETYEGAIKKEALEQCIKKKEKDISEKFKINENKTKFCIENAKDSAMEAINNATTIFFESADKIFQLTKIFSMELKICNSSRQFQCVEENKNHLIVTADTLSKESSAQLREIQKVANTTNLEHCRSYYEKTLKIKAAKDGIVMKSCFMNPVSRKTRYRRSLPSSKEEKKIQYYKEKYKNKLDKFSKEIDKEYQSGMKQLNENKNKMTNNFSYQIRDTKNYMESAKKNTINGIRNEWQKQQFSKCVENYEASLKYDFISDMENRASYCFMTETENGMKNMAVGKNSFEDSAVIAVRRAKKSCKNKSKSCYSKKKIFEETCKTNTEEMRHSLEVHKSKMENCYNSYSQNLKEARNTYQYMLDHCFQFINSNEY